MCRRAIRLTVFMCVILSITMPALSQEMWVGKDGSIKNTDMRGIFINKDEFYIATKSTLYRTRDIQDRWETMFALPQGANEINCISGRENNIFVGTKRGLFRSQDYGVRWQKVFKTIIPGKNDVSCVDISAHNPKRVIIGTKGGVFVSEDAGDRWNDISGTLKNRRMNCITLNREIIYAGGDDGLYAKRRDNLGWERLFVRSAIEDSAETGSEDTSEGQDEAEVEEISTAVNCIALKGNRLYIAANNKVLYSEDGGRTWSRLSSRGLRGTINRILPSTKNDKIYCATAKGVFEFSNDSSGWLELYKGMDKSHIVNDIIFDGQDQNALWAVTDKGLYRFQSGRFVHDQYIDIEKNLKSLKIIFNNEPTFRELQRSAMRFAEVNPDKISNWRREARLRALLPKISFGIDKDQSTTIYSATSTTKLGYIVGPDDLSSGIDVNISWELGDLIWSDDQTNIDVRSRLTTQLRNDILDDLRRAYYERRRLQFELIQAPPKDPKAQFEKELRLQELTQAIDDLTGNYLSDHLQE